MCMRNIMIKCAGCQHKKKFLSFKSKFTYPLIFVITTPVQRGTTWNNVNLWFIGVCVDCDVTVKVFDLSVFFFSRFSATNVGDEGGFAPNIQDNREG